VYPRKKQARGLLNVILLNVVIIYFLWVLSQKRPFVHVWAMDGMELSDCSEQSGV